MDSLTARLEPALRALYDARNDTEKFHARRQDLSLAILGDPLWVERTSRPGWQSEVPKFRRPEDVLIWVRSMMMGLADTAPIAAWEDRISLAGALTGLCIADPYLWRGGMAREALRSGLPKELVVGPETFGVDSDHVRRGMPGAATTLYVFQDGGFGALIEGEHPIQVAGVLWTIEPSRLDAEAEPTLVFHLILYRREDMSWSSAVFKYKLPLTLTDDHRGVADNGMAMLYALVSMVSFVQSPFVPREKQRVERSLRRRIERETGATLREVTFVDLRRVISHEEEEVTDEAPGDRVEETADGKTRRYRHRWIVRGHHRAQWYAKSACHKLIWIAPHMRGPSGAPLLEHVMRVRR